MDRKFMNNSQKLNQDINGENQISNKGVKRVKSKISIPSHKIRDKLNRIYSGNLSARAFVGGKKMYLSGNMPLQSAQVLN